MTNRLHLLLMLWLFCANAFAQTAPAPSCGQKEIMQHFYAIHPEYKTINQQVERLLAERNRAIKSGKLKTQRTAALVTLPVVVHIIHNNGTENITDAQVFQGIQHLNEAFANTGYYDPADGVNTQIQFCMAQRDPANNSTNGITRDVSAYTIMGGSNYYSDDQNVKDINRWNPLCYINIWLVKSIPTSVVGYAYLPSAHGSNVDGIIIEAAYFGSSYANDVVAAHEMGHYLGLYHTFEGGCTNNDCTADGDKVCDTPPDQSTAGISCSSSANSCSTDILSGFATDQNDLTQDYMDYGNFNCMKVFTQGQADRMNWFIQNVRKSLLACKSCMNPCPAPVTADFNIPASPFFAGNTYTFNNTSVNAASYEWYVNAVLKSTAANFSFTIPATGNYIVKMIAHSGNALCDDATKTTTVNAVCGAMAGFSKSASTVAAGTSINFTNTSSGADAYEWYVNSILQSTATNFSYTSSTAGDYVIQLIAKNTLAGCQQSYNDTVHYTCSVVADFSPIGAATLINTAVNFNSTGTGATTYQWYVNGIPVGNAAALNYTFTTVGAYSIQLVAGNGTCNTSKTAIEYVGDKCNNAQYQFQKSYAIGQSSNAIDILATSDGGSIAAINTTGSINFNGGLLKLDPAGNVQWSNVYGTNTNTVFKKVKQTADNGFIAVGQIQTAGTQGSLKTFIAKTDAAGNAVWLREVAAPGAFSNYGADILQAPDGSFYFTGTIVQPGLNGSTDVLAGKLDASGNLIWINYFDARGSETGNGLTDDNTHIIICGNKAGQGGNSGFLLQLNKTDGSVVWGSGYQSANENFLTIQSVPGGYFVNALRSAGPAGAYTDHVFLKMDALGKLLYTSYIQPFGAGAGIGAASGQVMPNGNIISQSSTTYPGIYQDFVIQEINPATGGIWSKTYSKPATWMNSLNVSSGKELWVAGFASGAGIPPLTTYIMKLDSAGNSGSCPSADFPVQVRVAAYTTTAVDFSYKRPQAQITSNDAQQPVTAVANTICQYVKCDSVHIPVDTCATCHGIRLSGKDTICSLTAVVNYTATRNSGCPAVPQWRLSDSSFGTIITGNDSTIGIQFNKSGQAVLHAFINTGCRTIDDSMTINILISPAKIDLGPDIRLCSTSTIRLNAGSGFASYLWNDGSIDSTLTAYNPGQYTVVAKDYCGMMYRDTINISPRPVINFDLGPDMQKCNTDTLTIIAPGSFSSYTWAANYNINTIHGATVQVWPSVDTTYTVVAQVANGCTVVDTIRISVKQSPAIHIGNDTSFCAGGSIIYNAPTGFTNYKWQDGSTGKTFVAKQAGVYWLTATAPNGCMSKDSAIVKNIYPLPVQFLDAEADICDGKDLELKAIGNWQNYLWFNNTTGPSVTINKAGHYWLQVTSPDGCIAKDTIIVSNSKGCTFGIHFPNAFTPDKNGFNDSFKPIVYGLPSSFRLVIYNRFGEKVYETTDYKKGWNGVYNGILQTSGAFVWYCSYRFPGTDPKLEKGSLLLLR